MFKSLTAKCIFISLIILSFIAILLYTSFRFTHHIEGEAAKINLAGEMRFRSFEMAWLAQKIVERIHEKTKTERASSIAELKHEINNFEKITGELTNGNRALNIKPIGYHGKEELLIFNGLLDEWNNIFKPVLLKIIDLPVDVPEVQAREVLEEYNERIHGYVYEIDRFVKSIEDHYEEEIEEYDNFRFLIIWLFVFITIPVVIFVRHSIVRPILRLKDTVSEIEKGNFDVRVDIRNKDELGELSTSFNQMAQTLGITFEENIRLANNLKALYDASNAVIGELDIDKLLRMLVEKAKELISARYVALSVLDDNGRHKYFITSGLEPGTTEEMIKRHGMPCGEGLLGHLLKDGKPLRIDDILKHPASAGFPEGHPVMKTFLGVPVILYGKAVGGLYFTDKFPQPPFEKGGQGGIVEKFTQEDEDIALSFANTAAVAIHNANLLKNINLKKDELKVLNKLSSAVSGSLSVEEILNNALDELLNLEQLRIEKKGGIFLSDEKTKTLQLAADRGFSEAFARLESVVPFGDCLCGIVADTGEAVISDDCFKDERHTRTYPEIEKHGHINLPLKSRDKFLGVLCLYLSPETRLSDEEVKLYRSIADIIAVSLHNALNHRQVAMLAQSLESSIDMIVITDMEGRITYVNYAVESQTGYLKDKLIGQPVSILQSPNNPAGLGDEIFRKTLEDGWVGEVINRKEDGSEFPVLLTTSLVKDADGKIIALIGIARDITDIAKVEDALRKSEASLSNAQRMARLGSWDWDIVRNELRWSDEIYRIFGLSLQEFGANYEAFLNSVHPDDREFVRESVNQALYERKPYSIDHRIVLPDGTERVVHEQAEVVFDESGKPVLMSGTVQDITERKQAEKELRRNYDTQNVINLILSFSLENIPVEEILKRTMTLLLSIPWLSFESRGCIFTVEEATDTLVMKAQSGLSMPIRKECARIPFGRCLCGQAALTQEIEFAGCLNKMHEIRYEGITSHGHYCTPVLFGGKTIGVINIYLKEGHHRNQQEEEFLTAVANALSGIIMRKKVETALERFNEELMEKVKERTEELEHAKLQAEAADRAKSDFLANMSHELRTPLNSIIGFSQLMIDRMVDATTDEQKEYLTDIYDSGKHLLSLINDILDLSKIEAGKVELDLSEFDLKELIDRSLIMFKEKVLKHGIRLQAEVEEGIDAITADERKIKQVLFNLLSNAFKFTLDGGTVLVHARMLSDDLIEISVADSGIGISAEDQTRLFQPFQQLESPMLKKRPGTGLGLNLCRQLVKLHGGRIWVESEPDKGSKFIFVIPRKAKKPVEQRIIDPLRRVLTWQRFLAHLERFLSFYKRNNRRLGLMKVKFYEINRPENHVSIVKVLKDNIRRYEVITYNEDNDCYYILLLDTDSQAVEQAAKRIGAVLKENGHPNTIKTAVYIKDGETVEELLKALNK
jgi:PAS domain S-box-containing protein